MKGSGVRYRIWYSKEKSQYCECREKLYSYIKLCEIWENAKVTPRKINVSGGYF